MALPYADADYIRSVAWGKTSLSDTNANNTILNSLASAASRELDRYLGTEPGFWRTETSSTRYFSGDNSAKLFTGKFTGSPLAVRYADDGNVDNVSGTGGSYVSLSSTDYFTFPYNTTEDVYSGIELDALNGDYYSFFSYPRSVKIDAYWGYRTVPDEIKLATAVQAVRWYARSTQQFQDAGGIKDLGQIKYTKAIDPEVGLLINHLKEIHL